MYFQTGNITPYNNENGKCVSVSVGISFHDTPLQDVTVNVNMDLEWDATLAEIREMAIGEAKRILTEMVSSF